MIKKALLVILMAVFVLVVLPLGWYYWQNNWPAQPSGDDLTNTKQNYTNERFGYSVDYPAGWFFGFLGNSKNKAQVVFFVSNKKDLPVTDALPLESKIEIIVNDLEELKEMDNTIAYINTIEEYVEWQKSYQAESDLEECIEENIKIKGMDSILEICDKSDKELRKSRKVIVLGPDKNYAYVIQYLGREPYYSENVNKFKETYKSFSF